MGAGVMCVVYIDFILHVTSHATHRLIDLSVAGATRVPRAAPRGFQNPHPNPGVGGWISEIARWCTDGWMWGTT